MRKWVVASALVTMFLAVACAEASPASAPAADADPTAVSVPLTPTELLQKSFDRMKDVRSYKALLEAKIVAGGEVFSGRADLAFAENGDIKISAVGGQEDFQIGIGVKVIPPDVYISIPLLGWHRIDMAEMAEDEKFSPEDFGHEKLRDFVIAETVPWYLIDAVSLGTEDVNGVRTEHLSVTADLMEGWRYAQESGLIDRLNAEFATEDEPEAEGMEDVETELSRLNITRSELWIDGEGLVRKAAIDASFEEDLSATLTVELDDYDTDIVVEPPSHYTDGLPGDGFGGFEDMIPSGDSLPKF